MKKFMTGVVAAMVMGVMAEITNTVMVTKFYQSYPYSGKATVEYTVGGALPANAVAEIFLYTDDTSAIFTQNNIVAGTNSHTIDFASSFGGAMLLTNASFVVVIKLGGVQLWENGPYWAECNVGASNPEDYGYYFWWGDTVGYTNTGSGWISVKDGTSISFSGSGMAATTRGKDNSALLSAGYIDTTGNLVAAHDAATAHLGSPWRMPTDAELSALINNCTTMWITTNGVNGRLVTGKGNYANKSIFLPAAGNGYNSIHDNPDSAGCPWSSTSDSDESGRWAWSLSFDSDSFTHYRGSRAIGRSVRPVRGLAQFQCYAVGVVTYDPVPGMVVPVATPTITGVTAQQRYPWNGMVDISYTVTRVVPSPVWLKVSATDRTTGSNYVASAAALSGDTGLGAATHRFVWDMSADGLTFTSTDVVFRVSCFVPPESQTRYCVVDLSGGTDVSSYPVSYLSDVPDGGWTDEYKTTRLVLRRIDPGSFMMCGKCHVTLTKAFYCGIFEVTQKQYELVTGSNPSEYKGDMRPVENISWNTIRGDSSTYDWPNSANVDPLSFMGRIQVRTGLNFDLPTEAQWEYACRAGTTSSYNNGGNTTNDLNLLGRYYYNRNDGKGGDLYRHTTVGSYMPNAWGLYDMHGNVYERCLDWYGDLSSGVTDPVGSSSGSNRVARSGCWNSGAGLCTSSWRVSDSAPSVESGKTGFRLARTLLQVLPSLSNVELCYGEGSSAKIDLTPGTRTVSVVAEPIRYSTAWAVTAPSDAVAVVAVDGMTLASNAGDGLVEWTPTRNGTYTLTHQVMSNGVQYGETLTATFLVDKPSPNAPVFSPASDTTFDSSLSVSISCATEGATIHYTTDGSEPTAECTVYRRFRIYGKTTVKAVAELNGILSDVVVAEYALGRCADPVIEAGTSFTGNKTQVSVSCATEGATVYYTLNGNDPDPLSAVYTEPFDVTNGCTLKVYATKAEYFDSAVVGKMIEKVCGIGETMGDPNQEFTTDGSGGLGWTRVVDATAPNGVAMKSGAITHSQSSVLSTTVTGPGTLTFSWRTSCEEDELHQWDHAEFAVDGTVRLILDGINEWRNESVAITGSGSHTVEWRYVKDNVESDGEDTAWAAGFRWEPVQTATQTTEVPVPYAWLRAHDPTVADEYEAYEAAAKNTAANGRKVWECYVLGLDPQEATSDFRIVSFPMKADGTPDWTNVAFDPPQERWNVPDAPVAWKGAAQLEGPWRTVSAEDGSPGTTRPTMRFFKAVVFGDADDDPDDPYPSVQLWEGGPYWATKNVGAEKPWEYGYYFWWGDTVGYAASGGTWTDHGWGDGSGYYDGVTWVSSTDMQMSSSPFDGFLCPTYGKNNSALLSAGYIDTTGNLAPEHDAAHVHWGGGWRMPTAMEFFALVNNCTLTWITTNGVSGQLVTGKGDYANRSIFLPATGDGYGSNLTDVGSWGFYWSSTPTSSDDSYDGSYFAEYLGLSESDSDDFSGDSSGDFSGDEPQPPTPPSPNFESYRCEGMPVRPVREADQ